MNQIIVLALDGEPIRLKSINISVTLRLSEKDMSGQASSTSSAEQGDKAKELRVSGVISFSQAEHLTRIFQLAEARGDNGAKKRYRIANVTAQAVNLRQGVFSGGVDVTEMTDKMAWQVTFTLKEQMSVPEKAAQRSNTTSGAAGAVTVKQQTETGNAEVTSDNKPNMQDGFWAKVNDYLGTGLDATGIGRADNNSESKASEKST
ncbi:MAG: hypothetical protein ACRC4K_02055 [Plesiomonas shigelloides]